MSSGQTPLTLRPLWNVHTSLWNLHIHRYSLRPETVESYFYLWRLTRDPVWRERGWAVFESLQKHCRTRTGYAALAEGGKQEDSMPSFWLAETLKCAPDNWTGLGCATLGLKPLQAMRLHRRSCAGREC